MSTAISYSIRVGRQYLMLGCITRADALRQLQLWRRENRCPAVLHEEQPDIAEAVQ